MNPSILMYSPKMHPTSFNPATQRTIPELLTRRYGAGFEPNLSPKWLDRIPEPQQQGVASMLNHHSVRRFADTPVEPELVALLVAAAQSASTSSNFQPWSVIVVRDGQRKSRLARIAGDLRFIEQAPVFLVWVADWSRAQTLAQKYAGPTAGLDYAESTMLSFLDTGIAAQTAALAAESLGLGMCYVGAVRNHPEQICVELELPARTFPVVGMAVGFAAETDKSDVKPRLPQDVVVHEETYTPTPVSELETYNETIRSYYQRFGADPHWRERVLHRISGPDAMAGRETLSQDLAAQDFWLG